MKKLFNEVKQLVEKDTTPTHGHLNKLAEEFGELAQAINKVHGIKSWKKTDTIESIHKNIKEELADNLQIIFGLASKFNIPYEDLKQELHTKNDEYLKFISSKTMIIK